jgi:outer membrane protein assembly factor BamB
VLFRSISTPAPFFAGVLIRDGIVYSPGGDGVLRAIRADTGAVLWTYDCGEELVTVPVLAEGRLLVASQSATLYALDAAEGKWVWQYRRTPPAGFILRGASTPVVREGIVYLGFSDGHAAALDAKTGGAVWDRVLSTGTQFIDVSSTIRLRRRLIACTGRPFALDPKTGDTVWQSSSAGRRASRTGLGHLRAGEDRPGLQPETGKNIWPVQLPDRAGQQRVRLRVASSFPPDGRSSSWTRWAGRSSALRPRGTATPGVYGPRAGAACLLRLRPARDAARRL